MSQAPEIVGAPFPAEEAQEEIGAGREEHGCLLESHRGSAYLLVAER